MPSPSTEPDLKRLLERARRECSDGRAWLGPGLPQRLSAWILHEPAPAPSRVAFIEVAEVSPSGLASAEAKPQGTQRIVGLAATRLDNLGQLLRSHEHTHEPPRIPLQRLICPAAVFDFGTSGPIVREIRRGLTAADLQAQLDFPLWAGPDLREWMAS